MQATDVSPSRVDAAKASAVKFLKTVPHNVAVGVVGFDGRARQLISPTTNLAAVQRTIENAKLGQGTAIGEAVYMALESIDAAASQLNTANGGATTGTATDPAPAKDGQPAGTIVLLSDGETTDGRPNDEAVAEAKKQGIAVNTIAFGTQSGTVTDPLTGESVNVPVNESALATVAHSTGGEALRAETATQLDKIYEHLGHSVAVEVQHREVTDWFAAIALLLLTLAATGSLLWFGRLP
jgi:Ca-activated chloride channel family protein